MVMTQEQKQEQKELLLKDLCGRLPYGVKAYVRHWSKLSQKYYEDIYVVKSAFPSLNEVHVQTERSSVDVLLGYDDYKIKPYLFPLSSMTEEQKKEYDKIIYHSIELHHREYSDIVEIDLFDNLQEFYHKNHFDYRGLIPMGLAEDATGLDIY
jgi:hypothetical protein